jgi:hypothetical protein
LNCVRVGLDSIAERYETLLLRLDASEAQLLLSLLVWPNDCPDPRLVERAVLALRAAAERKGAPAEAEDGPARPSDRAVRAARPPVTRRRGARGRFLPST